MRGNDNMKAGIETNTTDLLKPGERQRRSSYMRSEFPHKVPPPAPSCPAPHTLSDAAASWRGRSSLT